MTQEEFRRKIVELLTYINKTNFDINRLPRMKDFPKIKERSFCYYDFDYTEYVRCLTRAGKALIDEDWDTAYALHWKLVYPFNCNNSVQSARVISSKLIRTLCVQKEELW